MERGKIISDEGGISGGWSRWIENSNRYKYYRTTLWYNQKKKNKPNPFKGKQCSRKSNISKSNTNLKKEVLQVINSHLITSESQKSKSLIPVLKFCCLLASFSFWLFSADFCTRNCHWSARAARRAYRKVGKISKCHKRKMKKVLIENAKPDHGGSSAVDSRYAS